jgi:hypothetical protein
MVLVCERQHDKDVRHEFCLNDLRAGAVLSSYPFGRWAEALWSPDGRALAITDHAGSDFTQLLLIIPGPPQQTVNIKDETARSLGLLPSVTDNHHVYFEAVRWKDRETFFRIWATATMTHKGSTILRLPVGRRGRSNELGSGYPSRVRAWSRARPSDYRQIKLRAHELLADVYLHDVWQVELPGGGPNRTIADVRSLMSLNMLAQMNPVVRALLSLRRLLGRVFRWDSARRLPKAKSFLESLPEGDQMRSLVKPGTADGPFTILYVDSHEAIGEIRNATVHGFSVLALEPHPSGYRLFWAIYVAPVGWVTPFYMTLIDPFRRFLIYPAILRHLRRAWVAAQGRSAE